MPLRVRGSPLPVQVCPGNIKVLAMPLATNNISLILSSAWDFMRVCGGPGRYVSLWYSTILFQWGHSSFSVSVESLQFQM